MYFLIKTEYSFGKMITQELINRGGSKLEITRALIESGKAVEVARASGQEDEEAIEAMSRRSREIFQMGIMQLFCQRNKLINLSKSKTN